MYYEAQPDWSDIDWIHGLHGLMRRDQAWKANPRNSLLGKISRGTYSASRRLGHRAYLILVW